MKEYKKIIIISVFVMLTVLGSIFIKSLSDNGVFNKTSSSSSITTTKKTETKTTKESYIIVEIKGEVYYPGVYKVYGNNPIIEDVINLAGGLTKKADISSINLASLVENHACITIFSSQSSKESSSGGTTSTKININTCTLSELETLDGIGSVKAQKIITYRTQNGFFQKIEDLYLNDIITEALFEKIKDYITV